jgi:DNA-binding response OmpR family regulator
VARNVQRSLAAPPMRILLVEDDPKVAKLIARVLGARGYSVDQCVMGSDAVARVRSAAYELVVLDWILPDLDGLEVCRQVREEGSTIPILMVTARDQVRERVMALDAGADDYLVKPFKMAELEARIHALLRRAKASWNMKLGALEIERANLRMLLNGKRLDLTARETKLLMHLAQRAEAVVSRRELLEAVWSIRFDPETNVVEVHISRLREKLHGHSWMIETIRGQGYRLRTRRDG